MTFDNDYQKRFADYLRNQSSEATVMPSVSGNVYQNRFAAYLREQSAATTATPSVPSAAATPAATSSVKIPAAQTFSLGRALTSGGAMPESVRYATDNAAIGQYGKGNIDLYHRPQYRYEDGSIATVRSMSFNENGKEILVPTIAFDNAGKAVELTDDEAIDRYHRTGEYLGKFNTIAEADNYAERLHRAQDFYYNRTGTASSNSEREQRASGTAEIAHDLTGGVNHNVIVDLPAAAKKGVSAPFAAASNALTRARTALDKAATGKDYNTAIRAARWERYTKPTLSSPQKNPYQADAEALANVAHMTDAEQVHALELSGDSERGAYIQSLNLTSRRREAESDSRTKTAAAFEANTGKASKRESPEGRIIAANATWNPSYAVGKVQNVSGWDKRTAGETLSGRKSEYDYLTDRQRDTITLYAKAGDFQAVADYYNALLPDLRAKAAAESEEKHETFGQEHPVLSMGTQFASGMAGAIPSTLETVAGNVRNAVTGEYHDIDPNSSAYALTAASSAQARGAEERLENHPLLSIMRGGTVSAAQNLFLMWLGGGVSAGRQAVNTVLGGMALSSAGQSGYESLKEGKSAGRALADALVDAGIETATEELGMERWFKVLNEFDPKFVGNSLRQIARQLPAQMIVEGMEEVLGNELSQTWDMLSEGEQSEFSNRLRTLEGSGMSRADAASEAALELHVLRDAKAFAEAAFSVLLMDGAPASLSAIQQRNTFAATGRDIRTNGGPRAVNATIHKGLAFTEDSPARQAAEKLSEKWQDGKGTVSNRDIGRLSFLNGYALADVFQTIERRGDATARAKLREVSTRLDLDIYDKVALKDLRELVKFSRENTIPTFEEFLSSGNADSITSASANEMMERISRLDLDANGRPLVSWAEAVKEIKEKLPSATQREIQEIYHQYRNDKRTVLFGGHRLTLSEFTDLMRQSTDGEKLSAKQISGYFNQAILDTLDGSDAYERYILTDEQRQAKADEARQKRHSASDALGKRLENSDRVDGKRFRFRVDALETGLFQASVQTTEERLSDDIPKADDSATLYSETFDSRERAVEYLKAVTEVDPAFHDDGSDLPFYFDAEEREQAESVNLAGDLETKRQVARRGNFSLDENGTAPKNSENMPMSTESANADTANVSGEKGINESVATPGSEAFESGIDYNDPVTVEYARTLDKATRVKADTVSRLLGKRVRFAESVSGGIANGEITGNEIVLSRAELERAQEDGGLLWKILGHELTHGVQQDAGDAYALFRDAAAKEDAVRKHAENVRKFYELRGLSITEDAALDEAVADYGGQLMRDTDTAELFIERNRQDKSLLQKIRDALVKLIQKLTGAEKRQVQTVRGLFDAALDEAAKAVRNGETAAQKDGGVTRLSIDYDSDNAPFVIVEDDILLGVPASEWVRTVKDNLRQKFPNGVQVGSNIIKINRQSRGEMTFSHYMRRLFKNDPALFADKLRATNNADEILIATRNWVNEALLHPRKDSIIDFARGTVQLRIGSHDYAAQVIVGNQGKDGLLLYDIINLSPIAIQQRRQKTGANRYTANVQSELRSSQFAPVKDSIAQSAAERKGDAKFSLTGTEDAERLEQLIRQNRELEKRVETYRKQLAEAKTLSGARRYYNLAEANRLTEAFLKNWQSSLSVGNVRPDVLKLVNHLKAGPNGDGSVKPASEAAYQEWVTEMERQSRNIARRVIESAVGEVENPELDTIRDIQSELKSAKIAYDDLKAEMGPDFEPWRRRNQWRMGLRKNGRSVDSYWANWTARYGEEFFPSDITAPSDMLRHLSELLDRTATDYANPFDRYDKLEVVEDCKNALLDAIMNFDEQREIPVAERQAIRESAYQKGVRDTETRMSAQRKKLEGDKAQVRYERTQFREEQAWARQATARIEADLKKARAAVQEERANGQRKLDNYKDWQKRLREQRIETAKKNAVKRQLEQISSRLNKRNMPEGERAFLNSIFHNIDAIAKERIGVGADQLVKNLDYYWKRIDEGSDLYDEEFLENPFRTLDGQMNLAETANQHKLSGEEMTDVRKGFSGLNAEQLRRVLDFLRAFDHAQQTRNEMIAANDSRALNVQADEVIDAVRKAKGFSVPILTNMMRPRTFFRRLTGYQKSNAIVSAAEDMQAGERARDDYQRRGYETVLSKFAEGLGYSDIRNMSEEKRREAVSTITKAFRNLSGAEAAKQENLIEIHGIDPTTREEVTAYITRGMRAALYMHSRNEDNTRHIRYGGFVIPGVEKGGWNAYRKGDYKQAYMKGRQHVRLTISQIQEIVQDLTPEEKALADAAAWYYDHMSKPELSAVHEKLKGWSPFHVENYMPIETDEMFTVKDYETMHRDGTLGTLGFSLERVKAGNSIILRDLNLTLLDSINRHSRFIGLAIPVRNMNKLLNRNQVILADEADALRMAFSEDEARDIEARAAELHAQNPESKSNPILRAVKEFQGADGVSKFQDTMRSHSIHKSVRDNITTHFGEAADAYITKLMRDMTGVGKEHDAIGRILSTLTSNYAGAVLTLNTSTALVQTASYPTAAAVLGPAPLLKAMKDLPSVVTGNVDLERIHIYTPRLWQRSQGYSTWETETMSVERHILPRGVRKGVNIIQGMDVGTTTLLWKACEYYVDEENARRQKDGIATLEKGSPEQIAKGRSAYYREVADVYNRVLEETQPSYGTMERPQVLRSQNDLVRLTNMFKTQMYQNFNILYDAFEEMGARQRDMDAERNTDTESAFRQARTNVTYALVSQTAAALIAAVIKGAFAVFTGSDDKYKDKEGHLTGGSWAGGVLRGTVATFPGFVAYGSEAYSALATLIDRAVLKALGMDPFFRETFYGVNISMFSSLETTVTKTGSALGGLVSALAAVTRGFDDEDEGKRVDWPALGQKVLSAATDWSMFLGLPARNMEKLLYGVVRTAAVASMGDTAGAFATRKLLSTTLDTEIYRLLYQALADGDLETFKAMAEDVQRNFQTSSGKPVTGKTIRDRMLSMYRTEEQEKGTSRLGQAARDYIGAVEKYSVETPEKFTEGDLSPAQYRAYRDEYEREFRTLADALERSSAFRVMDDKQRLDVKANAAKLTTEFALEHQSGGEYEADTSWMRWAVGGGDYNVTADVAILFKAAYDSTESDKDKSGKTISGSRKKNTLTLAKEWIPGLSKQQLLYLQSFYWEPENSKLKALKENGYRKAGAK